MDPFRNFTTYKINALTEIRNAGIVTDGQVYWVSSVDDSDHRQRTDLLGGNTFVRTSLQSAIDMVETDVNDYVLVVPTDGGTVRALGTAVDVNEDRIHILGVGSKPAPQLYDGLTFRGYVAADVNDTELVLVTGAGCEIGGLKFLGTSGTAATGTITAYFRLGTAASGTPHDTYLHDLHVENDQAAAAGGTAPIFEVTGDVGVGIGGLRVDRCWFGNANWGPTPVVNLAGTAGPTRAEFNDCRFVMDAQAVGNAFVTGGTGDIEYMVFDNCKFINVESGTLNDSAYSGVAGADTPVLFKDCIAVNVTQLGSGLSMYKSPAVSGTAAGIRDHGLAIGTAAIISA